jgi:hypothetical protein
VRGPRRDEAASREVLFAAGPGDRHRIGGRTTGEMCRFKVIASNVTVK